MLLSERKIEMNRTIGFNLISGIVSFILTIVILHAESNFSYADMVMTEECPAACWTPESLAYYDDNGTVGCGQEGSSETICWMKSNGLSSELFVLDEYTATCYNLIENSTFELSEIQYLDCAALLEPILLRSNVQSY